MLKKLLTSRQKQKLKLLAARSLDEMARICGTNKAFVQGFMDYYEREFREIRKQPATLLEIGIGGWDDEKGYSVPTKGGESLRMWKAYFPNGSINGIDICDKRPHEEKRIRTFQGSQTDEQFLRKVVCEIGQPDIIIDDGSHICSHVITSFETLFPLLAPGGIYAIEDLQTSYLTEYEGSLDSPSTSMNYLKKLADGINYRQLPFPYEPSYFDRHIESLTFYPYLCVIRKLYTPRD